LEDIVWDSKEEQVKIEEFLKERLSKICSIWMVDGLERLAKGAEFH
jgi:hypothetical protein